ncbi:MAG: hypothetical protein NUV78_00180 [Candidatus Zambryskibacteria bacterium]|nr:hypothetical protein [Candidatus Zambryskibacteria bacterium]
MNEKLTSEQLDCAEALKHVSLSDSVESIQALIDAGYALLRDLQALPRCNPNLVNALALRLDNAEYVRDQRKLQDAQTFKPRSIS